jgi:signal transduction histidine kinase
LLAVKDSGKGIPAESLNRVFDRFYRVPDQEAGTVGTGLGLAIAQRIAKNHQGIIEVESVLNQGSTFTLRLPQGMNPES